MTVPVTENVCDSSFTLGNMINVLRVSYFYYVIFLTQ